MNSTDQAVADIAALIAEQDNDVIQSYCIVSAVVLLVYHHLATIDSEVQYFWKRAWTQGRKGVTWTWALFLANRYLSLVVYIYQAPWWPVSDEITGCTAAVISQYIMEFSEYALWGVLVLGCAPVVSDVVSHIYA
ncbi:hypothetical protein C8Q77DRAFT_1074812 [Trametes polyzona]|nr:hypothetical protein C8Q77DRAFT_1074812 [Trametes polyzona]